MPPAGALRDKPPVTDLLDQLRQRWEDAEAEAAELAAENDRLRQHLARAAMPEARPEAARGPKLHGPALAVEPPVSPMALLSLGDKEADDMPDMPPVLRRNQRRRPSFRTPGQALEVPLAKLEVDETPNGSSRPDSEMGCHSPRSALSASATSGVNHLSSGSEDDVSSAIDFSSADPTRASSEQDGVNGCTVDQLTKALFQEQDGEKSKVSASPFNSCNPKDEEIELHGVWRDSMRRRSSITRRPTKRASKRLTPGMVGQGPAGTLQRIRKRNFVIHPNGVLINVWNVLLSCVLVYDLVFVPLQAFELNSKMLWYFILELLATCVWTGDMFLSFFKGIEKDGALEMKHRKIIHRYASTWFLFDLTVVTLDWTLLLTRSQPGVADLRWVVRIRRLVQLMRVARLFKHSPRFFSLLKLVRSDNWLMIFRIFWLMLALVMINHFVCCGWYAIGGLPALEERWTLAAFEAEDSLAYRYSTAFHWSITQFTPASMEVVPVNWLERAYCVTSIFFGLLIFSAFVSNMTNSMTYLTRIHYEKAQQRELLRRYIETKNVSMELSYDVINHISASGQKKPSKRLLEKDIACLAGMPSSLLERLHEEVHAPVLQAHPLFAVIEGKDSACFRAMCHNATEERACIEGEEVFRFGQRCKSMMFVVAGRFNYCGGFGSSTLFEDVLPGAWLCEASIWVNWEYRGNLTSASEGCELALLDVAEVHLVFGRCTLYDELRRYARHYAKSAIRENSSGNGINDMWGQDHCETMVREIFKQMDDVEAAAAKMLQYWRSEEYSDRSCFNVWKKLTRRERYLRRGGLRGVGYRLLYRVGVLDRLLSQLHDSC